MEAQEQVEPQAVPAERPAIALAPKAAPGVEDVIDAAARRGADVQAARAILAQEQAARETACWGDLRKVLEAHRCRLEPQVIFRAGSVHPSIVCVAE